jgi:hypothetical protein
MTEVCMYTRCTKTRTCKYAHTDANTHIHMQILLSSSAAGQCGSSATCDASVPITDMSLSFDNATLVAGDPTGISIDMLVTVPIQKNQTIDVVLSGFTTSGFLGDFSFDVTEFRKDSAFVLNSVPTVPGWTRLGCVSDKTSKRYMYMCVFM